MRRISSLRRWTWALAAATAILGLLVVKLPTATGLALTPEGEVRAAWRRAQELGQYHFSSELVQTTHPGPALMNVGRSRETEVLYMEGEANLPDDQLQLALWDNEGSAFNPQDAVEVRIAGEKTEGRVAGGPWQEVPEFSDAFAPGRDLMGYLAGMRNVRDLGVETRALETSAGTQAAAYQRYAFEMNGPDFAAYMRDQMERHLIEHGELPAGMSLSLSDTYRDLTGEGEVWLGSDGLPRRIEMHMIYPEMPNGDWVEAEIINDFYGYPRTEVAASPLARISAALRLPDSSAEWQRLLMQTSLAMGTLGLLLLLVTVNRSRLVYAGFAIAMVVAMVVTPVLQSHHVYAFNVKQAAREAEQEAAQEESDAQREYEAELYLSDWNPNVNPLEAAAAVQEAAQEAAQVVDLDLDPDLVPLAPEAFDLVVDVLAISASSDCVPDSEVDSDGDGLSDKVEAQLGTRCSDADSDDDTLNDGIEVTALGTDPLDQDTDGDGIYDNVEVEGFEYNGRHWYSDPLNADTNKDGQSDTLECPERLRALTPSQVCRDTDGDGTPDLFDDDNDDDGVPDRMDLSPQTQQGAFDLDNPFAFKIDTDTNGIGKPLIVDLQLRPTNPDHLTYARNVLDWPSGDEAGQLQRRTGNDSTFADLPNYPGGDPSAANGDMRLIPMLELRMAGHPLPLPMTTPSATLTLQDSEQTLPGNLILQHSADNQIRFTFTEAALTYSFKIYEGVCGQRDRRETYAIANAQGSYTLSGPRLTDFANGNHSLDVTHDGKTVCVTVPDIPNGSYTDQMIDEAALSEYGMMVQDTNDDGRVIVYAPLNVVPDSTGGGRVAFATRLFYQQHADTWGDQHQARVVWLLQVLSDSCQPIPQALEGTLTADQLCPDKKTYWVVDQTQVIHTYTDEWTLTGMTVREDHGLDVAVVYPDPATGGDSLLDENLWQVASGLEGAFVTGRSQDGVNRDITIAEIVRRFDYGSTASEQERWGIPNTALRVQRHTFANLDEIVTLATTHSRAVLDTFSHDKTPTLLLARESNSRNANLDDRWDGASATLRVDGNVHTVASFQWTPYHHLGAAGWQPYPLDSYLDQLGPQLKSFFESQGADYYDPDDPDVLRGAILSAQMYSLALVNGVSAGIPDNLKEEITPGIEDSAIWKAGSSISEVIADTAGGIAKSFTDFMQDDSLSKVILKNILFSRTLGQGKPITYRFKLLAKYFYYGTRNKVKSLWNAFSQMAKWKKGLVIAAAVVAVVALVGIAVGVGVFIGLSPDKIAAAKAVVTIGLKVISLIINLVEVVSTIITAVKDGLSAVANAISAAPIVGLIVSTSLAVGVFAVQMTILIIMGQFSVTALLSGIADLIAATMMAVFMMALAATGVGAIIVAVIGLIDALIAVVCAALPEEWTEAAQDATDSITGGALDLCGGISGFLTNRLKANYYSNVSIVTFDDPQRLAFTSFNPHLADPTGGFTPGQRLQVDLDLRNALNLTDVRVRLSNSWMTMVYFWQYNLAMLRYSSFKYVLSPSKRDVHGALAFNSHYEDWFSLHTGSNAIGADFLNLVPGQWAITRTLSTDNPLPITEAGFNRHFDLYLLEGYAVPHQECVGVPIGGGITIPVCWMRPEWGSRPLPLSDALVFDIFPATLTEFYQLRPEEGGYALAWDNHLHLSFPRLRDADGDGLTYESDPNDSRWDTDGDGLSDYFETQQGLVPTSSDTDGDGLSDREELLYETDPFRRDTDGDGLTDKEERDGWEFVYDFNDGNPKTTWVTSDPLEYDTDGDGIRDDREKVFGFNPRVWSDPQVLDFESQIYERAAPRMLLRFEESGAEAGFADASGYGNAATCSSTGCPALEWVGYHGYARDFDGVDDAVHVPAEVLNDLTSGTIATWVYLDDNTEETLFAKQHDGVNSYGVLSVGYTPTQMGDAGRVYFHARNGASLLQSNALLQTGQWYHIAATFDAEGACMHVNGVLEVCVAGDHTIPDDLDVTATTLGAHLGSAGGRYLDGRLDEFAIFPYVLSVTDVQRVANGGYTYQDGFVQPGSTLAYEGTVSNEMNGRYAEGLHYGDFPAAVQAPTPRNFTLQPRGSTTLAGTLQVNADAPTQRLALTQVAGARSTDPYEESGEAQLQLHFDDAAGATTFQDTSGFPERPGACSGSACPTTDPEGRYGSAFRFDGDDYVTVDYAADLNNTSFTVAAWAKVTGGSGYRAVLTSREASPARGYMLYATPSNTWELWVGNGSEWVPLDGGAITPNAWTHLAGVYNATNQTLIFYVNGKEATRQSGVTFAPNSRYPLRIGAGATEGAPQFHFTGLIDEVHVYEDARDAGEVNQLFQMPVLWWKAATPLVEHSLFRHDTGCQNGCPNSEGRFGSPDGHVWFTGRNNSALDLSDGHFTVSAWVKPEVSGDEGLDGSNQAILGYDNANAQGNRETNVTLMRRGNALTVVTRFGNAPTGETGSVTFPNVFTRDRWHHIVVTSSPGASGGYDIKLYVDNILHSTGNVTLTPNSKGMFIRRAITYKTYTFNFLFISEQKDCDGGAQDRYELQAWWNPTGQWETLQTVYGPPNNTTPKKYLPLNVSRLAGSHLYTKFQLIERDGSTVASDDIFVERQMTVDSSLDQPPYTFGTSFNKWDGNYVDWCGNDGAKGDMQVTVQQNSVPFVGAISEVAIYKNAFDDDSVDELYRARSGLMELPFDDAPGRTAFRDMTGHTSARCSGDSCPVSGLRGRVDSAVRFDGVDDRIVLGSDGRFDLPPAFTFGAWIYPTGNGSGGAEGGILINKESAYQIARFADGTIRWRFANSNPAWNWADTGCTAPLNTWTHIAVTYDNGAIVTYKNGEACHTYAGSGVIAPANQEVWLGGRGWADQYFAGMMDDVGLYKLAYTAAQVDELYRQAPQFNLTLDEDANATTFTDIAGGQSGTCSGSACPDAGAQGQIGLAANFDGVDDALSVPANALNNLGAGTLATWVYLNSAEEEVIFAKQHDGVNAYAVLSVGYTPRQAGESGRVYFHAQNDAPLLQSTATLPTGYWHHVAVTFDGANAHLYINGELDAKITDSAGLSIPDDLNVTATTLGAHLGSAGGRHLSGRLDEFAIYHRALSGLEIERLYEAQNAWVEERQTTEMIVDADPPTSWLVSDTPYRANRDAVLHIGAQDPATVDSVPAAGVDRVIWRVNAGVEREAPACRDAEPGAAWCPTFDPTALGGEGAYTIKTYAIDRVGNKGPTASTLLYVDATPPVVSTGIAAGALLPVYPHPAEARAWAVTLSGSVSDPNLSSGGVAGSGVSEVQVTLYASPLLGGTEGGAQVGEPVLATVHGNVWSVAYPLYEAEPTGDYTLRVTAGDRVGNSATHDLVTFHLDASAPSAQLDATGMPTATLNSTSGTLHGVVSEIPLVEGALMHLMFEESAGATTFADSTGQANRATCSGAACPTAGQEGQIGSALAFDGTDDALRIENFGDFDTASVSAWVYRTGETDGRQALVSYKAYSACGFALLLNEGNRGNQPGFLVNVDGTWQYVEDDAPVPLNTWVHLAATYNGVALQLYRDGVLVSELDAPGKLQQCTELTGVGAQPYGDMHFFPGRLDDVRIFGHGLISDEVARLAQRPVAGVDKVEVAFTSTTPGSPFYNEPAPAGQVLHLPLDDQPNKEGNVLFRDIAAPAQNGVCRGAGCPSTGVGGRRGTAVSFDGVNDAIKIEDFGDFTTASVSAWVYRTDNTTWREALVSYKNYGNCGFILSLNEDKQNHRPRIWVKINGTWQYAEQPVSVPLHTWTHLAATYDGDTVRLYRDGALVAEQAAPGGMEQCDAPTGIGAQPDATQVLWGALDDVRVFNRALSAAEVKALWQGSDPLLHLTFDDQRVIDSPLRDRSAWGHDGLVRATLNVAAGKAATQSSCLWPHDPSACEASKAVDGNTGGDFQDGSVTHTAHEYRPWWQVDLGTSYNIAALDLWNRTDCCGARLSNFYVFVSDVPFVGTDLDAVRNQPDVWAYYHAGPAGTETELPVNRTGRYVRVQLAGSEHLSLAEVQVWGHPAVFDNVALEKPTAQSSTYAAQYSAEQAVDGVTSGDFAVAPGTHTQAEHSPWWQVDLGAVYDLDTLDLWNRTDGSIDRLSDFYVFVSDTPFAGDTIDALRAQPGMWWWYYGDTAGAHTSLPVNRTGRYVRVQLTPQYRQVLWWQEAVHRHLALAEVQVWSKNANLILSNLAERREAFQSSAAWPDTPAAGHAGLAVDGDTNGDFNAGSVTHTADESRPFWQVDLGTARAIETLDLWNRTDGSSERLSNFYVLVSNTPFAGASLDDVLAQSGIWSYHHAGQAAAHTTIPVGRSGRYVRVQLSGATPLSLAEVQVWGYENDPPLRTVPGHVGNGALALDGGNDYVEIPTTAFNDLSAGTIATWVYLDDNTEATIFAKQHDGVNSYGVLSVGYTPSQAGDAGRVYFHTKNGASLLQSNATLPTGQWTHLAATFDATGACLYVNGVQDACAAGDHTIPDDLQVTATTLGAHLGTGGGRYLYGMLDDFTIYPRVLPAAEVAALARQGWQTASVTQHGDGVTFSDWSAALPPGLEGSYQIDVRGSDTLDSTDARVGALSQWEGGIDTLAPRIDINASLIGSGAGSYTNFYITVEDFNLTTEGYVGPCHLNEADGRETREYYTSPWYLAAAPEGARRLYRLQSSCQPAGDHRTTPVTFCDTAGNCATASAQAKVMQRLQSTPLLDAAVLTPTHASVFTTLDPVALAGAAYAQAGLDTLTVTVGGGTVYTQSWPAGVITDTWATSWTPAGDGAYRVAALLRDRNGLVLTETQPITFYVDTLDPSVAIRSDVLTSTHYQPSGFLNLRGVVSDSTGIDSVEWSLDGSDWQPAQVEGDAWTGLWNVGFENLPDGASYTLAARATDLAGRVAEISRTVAVDLVGPEAVTLTHALAGGSLTVEWTESSDPAGLSDYELHWTTRLTETEQTVVTAHPPGSGGSVNRPVAEGSKVTIHLDSRDAYGNVTRQPLGPIYVESALTPDYVTPDEAGWYRGWTASECSQLGTDARIRDRATGGAAVNTAQDFYAGWNSDGLRLTWEGANWRTDGDLFVYLDTQPGGSTRAYNPYVTTMSNTTILLPNLSAVAPLRFAQATQPSRSSLRATNASGGPMGADYAVWMPDPEVATLLAWNALSTTWETVTATWAYHVEQDENAHYTDLYLPFSTLGIADPAVSSLSLVALATEEEALRLWATMPPRNPVNSAQLLDALPQGEIQRFALLQAYTWPSLGEGVCPNGTQTPPLNLFMQSYNPMNTAQQPARQFSGGDVRWSVGAAPSGIAYSVLGDNLFNIMDEVFTDLTDWDAVDAELCALYPDDPECAREEGGKASDTLRAMTARQVPRLPGRAGEQPALSLRAPLGNLTAQQTGGSVDFDAQDGLAATRDVQHPAVGDGQTITYTVHYVNRGVITSTGLTADIVTWGPVRLLESEGAHYSSDTVDGELTEWYSLILPLGDLAPGEVLTATFTGVIDLNFDPANAFGWATVDVIFYDDTGSWDYNQLDWFYVDHEVDDEAPSVSLSALPGLIGPGENRVRGTVSDQSAVPTVTLAIQDPTGAEALWDCEDATPEDGAWSCTWDAGDAAEGETFYLSAQATDIFGQVGSWSPSDYGWYTFTVDATPPTLALNWATEEALADGLIGPDETGLGGTLSDNRLAEAVEICDGAGSCTTLEALADTTAVSPTLYVYEDVPAAPIPIDAGTSCDGGNLIARTFTVKERFTVGEVAVGLNLTHDYRYDLEAWLIAPSGAWANILWNGTDAENYDVLLQDASTALLRQDEEDHDVGAPYFDYERRPDDPLSIFYGEPAQGEWQILICDYFPAEDDGAYHRSQLLFTPRELPQDTAGTWEYELTLPRAVDGVTQTLTLYGLDSVGNRSLPLTLTFAVDTVAPVLTVTQQLNEVVSTLTTTVMSGESFDGSGVASLYAVGETPDGQRYVDALSSAGADGWSYLLQNPQPGDYTFYLYAEDGAGNLAVYGPYTTRVVALPSVLKSVTPATAVAGDVVTYTLNVANPNPEVAITGLVITDHLPTEMTPLASLGDPYELLPNGDLRWSGLSLAAGESHVLSFTAQVSDSLSLWGDYLVNTATFACDLGRGAANSAAFRIFSQPISIVDPLSGAFLPTDGAPSTTLTVTVQTYVNLPDVGYWTLWSDGVQVGGPVFTYTAPLSLTLGTRVISATLHSPDGAWLGEDAVEVYVVEWVEQIYLPLVMRKE